jgi:hypothetical protein
MTLSRTRPRAQWPAPPADPSTLNATPFTDTRRGAPRPHGRTPLARGSLARGREDG